MSFNILGFFENLFHIGQPQPAPATPPPTPPVLQDAINTAGRALDDAEAILNTLQGVATVLPGPFQGYLAAFAVALHGIDAYVDTLEVPATPASPPTNPPA